MEIEEEIPIEKGKVMNDNIPAFSPNDFAQSVAEATFKSFERFFSSFQVNHLPTGNLPQKNPLKRPGMEISRDDLKKSIPNSREILPQTNPQPIAMETESNEAEGHQPEGYQDPQIEEEDEDSKNDADK